MKAKQLSGGISVSTCNPSLLVCVMATEASSESAVRAHGGEEEFFTFYWPNSTVHHLKLNSRGEKYIYIYIYIYFK